MRATLVFAAGILLGVVLTFTTVGIAGGWYVYSVVPLAECQDAAGYGLGTLHEEVVPNQPNPCHFRRPRWHLGS